MRSGGLADVEVHVPAAHRRVRPARIPQVDIHFLRAERREPRGRRAVRHGRVGLREARLEFVLIELPCVGAAPLTAALLRILHDAARVIVEARDQRRGVRSGSRREAGLVHRVDLAHVQAQIIDGQFRGLVAAALLERRLDFLPYGGEFLGGGDRGLLHGRTLVLPGRAGAAVLAHARRHLARRAGGAEESVLEQSGVAVGDVGRRLRPVTEGSAEVQIHSLGRIPRDRLARQVEVDAALSAFQVEVHAAGRRTAHRPGTREQRILGRELLAHDEDLLPLPGRGLAAGVRQLARRLQELILVAPHEEYFEELQSQIAARGFAGDGDADQIRGLVIQAVRHVEVSFRERVALVEVDRRLAADRLIARNLPRRGRRRRRSGREARPLVRRGFLHQEIGLAARRRLRGRKAAAAREGRLRGRARQAAEGIVELRRAARTDDPGRRKRDERHQQQRDRPPVAQEGVNE